MNDEIPAYFDAPNLAEAKTPVRQQISNAAGEVEQQRAIAETKAAIIVSRAVSDHVEAYPVLAR